jgi:2-amino-4-hydroxy-6-hydroxymethyldihydropteridine diphosphokinase|tara:strand:+ start:3138 stop:3653 length:516 start_codon:yes stop_codon:yes gene_type:complete
MIILGLGSNLSSKFGDRFKNIELAISIFESHNIKILKKSGFYETPSYPNKKNPKFINMVVAVKTDLKPFELMSFLLSVEKKLGRLRDKKNDPRTCDLDIIDYNNEIIEFIFKNNNFFSPHKNLSYRNFVLYPLKEILPLWKHPVTNESIDMLIAKLSNEDKKSILKIKNLL